MSALPVLYPDDRDSDMAGQAVQVPAELLQGAPAGRGPEDFSGISVLPEDDEGAQVVPVQHGVRDPCSRADLHDSFPAYGMALPIGPEDPFYTVEGIRSAVPHFYEKTASVESQEGDLSFGNFRKGEK